jgi:hypothetical protein
MFDRIKKAFSWRAWAGESGEDSIDGASAFTYAPMSEWAATQGLEFSAGHARQSFSVTGRVAGKSWRLELGPPSRSYIDNEELRARAEMGLDPAIAVILMSRHLKETLQAQADRLPAHGPALLPQDPQREELQWLSQYPEVDWIGPSLPFWGNYAVMAANRQHAVDWLDIELVRQLMAWPLPGVDREVPFVLCLLQGKVYLRMEYRPADLPTLQHAAGIFTNACEAAAALAPRPPRGAPAAAESLRPAAMQVPRRATP